MPTPGPGTTGSGTPASPAPSSTPSSSWTSRACPTCSGRSSATTSSRAARRARPRGGDAGRDDRAHPGRGGVRRHPRGGGRRHLGMRALRRDGRRARDDSRAVPASAAGSGRVQHVAQTAFGQFVQASACAACGGRGVRIDSPCQECRGRGRLSVRRGASRCRCRAGIASGQRLRLAGRGHDGEGGARRSLRAGDGRAPTRGSSATGTTSSPVLDLPFTRAALGATRRRRDARGRRRRSR